MNAHSYPFVTGMQRCCVCNACVSRSLSKQKPFSQRIHFAAARLEFPRQLFSIIPPKTQYHKTFFCLFSYACVT